jgi:membrane protein
MEKLKGYWELLKHAGSEFKKHKIPKLSASLAYYTVFTLGPMLLIIMFISKTFWGSAATEGRVYSQMREMVGDGPALQIQEIIKNASIAGNDFIAFMSGVVLLIAATTAFTEMQDSLNIIWNLRIKKGTGMKLMLRKRLLSFSMIAGLGFLLLVSLIINVLLEGFMTRLQELFPQISVVLIYVINVAVTLVVVSLLFAIIFKVLPDAIIKWKDVAVGAMVTAILFMLGKYCITLYISKSDFGSSYGTAGSLVVLLLWIYISSIILYTGAAFTKLYAMQYGSEIKPDEYAVTIKTMKVESRKTIQENEKDIESEEVVS